MLLPSSIQRAEALVGMAMPTVGLLCASAGPARTTAPSARAERTDLSSFMLHSQVLSVSRRVAAAYCWRRCVSARRRRLSWPTETRTDDRSRKVVLQVQ